MISCSLRNETNSNLKHNIKCEHIGSVLEFMSRREQFEKCFTFFNINQMDKNFVNYEMIKWNSIEFAFLSKQFGNYIQFEDSIIEKIYVLGGTKSPWKPLLFLVYKDVSQDSC
jgi:hypothetical protein